MSTPDASTCPKRPGSVDEFELLIERAVVYGKPDVRPAVRGSCYGPAVGQTSPVKPVRPLRQSYKVWLDPEVTSHDIEVKCRDEVVVTSHGSPGMATEHGEGNEGLSLSFVSSKCPMIVGDVSPMDALNSAKDYGAVFAKYIMLKLIFCAPARCNTVRLVDVWSVDCRVWRRVCTMSMSFFCSLARV